MPWQGLVFLLLMVGIPVIIAWWLGGPPKEEKAAKRAAEQRRGDQRPRDSATPSA